MIDIKLFKEMYDEIDSKVEKIRELPMLHRQESDYDGWEFEEYQNKEVFVVKSSTYYSGCNDSSSFEIPLSEINNSVEWFKEKFQNEIDESKKIQLELQRLEKERVAKNRVDNKEQKRKTDLATYRRIKKELEK